MLYGRKEIEQLIDKSVESHDSQDALRFSQAAQNAANALLVLYNIESHEKSTEPSNT